MSKVFAFRLPADLRRYIETQATRRRTSMGHYIVMLIDKDKTEKENQHGDCKTETVTD